MESTFCYYRNEFSTFCTFVFRASTRDKGLTFTIGFKPVKYFHISFSAKKKVSGVHIEQNVIYTQTKKKRPIFTVLYLSIQLRCCNKSNTKMFIKRPTHKNGNYLILSSDLEELLNLMCIQIFPLFSGK